MFLNSLMVRSIFFLLCLIFIFPLVASHAGYRKKLNKPIIVRKKIKPPPKSLIKKEKPVYVKKIPPVYDPTGKSDPFKPFFQHIQKLPGNKKPKPIDLSHYKLTAILLAKSGNRALVQDATGNGMILAKGDFLGNKSVQVVDILKDRVIVNKRVQDEYNHNEVIILTNELRMYKPDL